VVGASVPATRNRDRQHPASANHGRELFRRSLLRQLVLYYVPLLLLAAFFLVQYRGLVRDSTNARLEVIAEHQANTLDLFLRERVVNLRNVIAEPTFSRRFAEARVLEEKLGELRQTSDAFVDIGVVGARGALLAYDGGANLPRAVQYGDESWFRALLESDQDWIITDNYLGIRQQPHFTIAVKRESDGELLILRAALSPERINAYLNTLEGAREVYAAVVNATGVYQAVTERRGSPLAQSPYHPPREPARGHMELADPRAGTYGYSWLHQTPWALVVTDSGGAARRGAFAGMPVTLFFVTLAGFVLMGAIIVVRARQITRRQLAMERHEEELSGQLVQAAKLASVGELAAGIAHEINNPLAIIAEEAGLLKDSLDPELADDDDDLDLVEHLNIIHEAVFRCRDITRKLLTFVRKEEVCLGWHQINEILDDVVDGMLANELSLGNVSVAKDYDATLPEIVTDRNQLVQVLVNLVKNAIDAMSDGGTLTIRTVHRGNRIRISVKDDGCGMTKEQLQKVFMPFFTTKDPGAGTGLGLSVSFSIIRNFGGEMFVESAAGRGSTFTLELPLEVAADA
jgi:two-component system NtrC family sensor kinase